MTMNRDRIRSYKCWEYDHFANECPNIIASDSDGHESDNVALQICQQIENHAIHMILLTIWKTQNI